MPSSHDWINNPLSVVKGMFEDFIIDRNTPQHTPQTSPLLKKLDMDVLVWCGYTWSVVVRPVGCTAKFSKRRQFMSYYLSMSLHTNTMNSLHLVPTKDSVANQLVSGALQLARDTALFLDEMQLEQGQLDTSGVWNIPALGNMISWQKVDYDFNYHKVEFPCNINVLITSEGRSLLPVSTKASNKILLATSAIPSDKYVCVVKCLCS
ncbi:mini-chromosome maintenance complex-binding protein-like isoform X2 [Oncorhynchus keta]|uniref:mini-chromosome maintenance complex-binding protein-like isoform X2 n=1 Tax=Oncorhynchus keta TaxID=8018 RepID=UPI0015F9E5F5|nr:mini-chromosome maintenance complex-binding protein-like isoform X2 [Oncorhynchus keta]XP_035655947.1 mini-chromosome maintenance complex-binding protein-like isoform X2 [Oncorhynchus keta]